MSTRPSEDSESSCPVFWEALDVERFLVSVRILSKEDQATPQRANWRVRRRLWPNVRLVVPSPRYAGTRRLCPSLAPRAAMLSFKLGPCRIARKIIKFLNYHLSIETRPPGLKQTNPLRHNCPLGSFENTCDQKSARPPPILR